MCSFITRDEAVERDVAENNPEPHVLSFSDAELAALTEKFTSPSNDAERSIARGLVRA